MGTIRWQPMSSIWTNNPAGTIVVGSSGSGKALLADELIPTPQGYTRNGDLKVGDYVFDRHGKLTRVLGVYPQGEKDVYRVHFSDGRYLDCCKDHLISFYTEKQVNRYTHHLYRNIPKFTTKSVLDLSKLVTSGGNGYYIPNNDSIERDSKNYSLHPYVLGVLLGDGCLTIPQLTISSNDSFIVEKVSSLLNVENNLKRSSTHTYSWNFVDLNRTMCGTGNKLVPTADVLREVPELINTHSYEKFIPEIYKFGSIEQRTDLLRGLLDTDGCVNKKNRLSFTSTSKRLIDDIREVLWSLGISSGLSIDNRVGGQHKHICYQISIQCSDDRKKKLLTLPRKLERIADLHRERTTRYEFLKISGVEKLDKSEEMVCIYVDNEEHLYQASKMHIVTHNTIFLLSTLANTLSLRQRVLAIDPKNDLVKIQNVYPNVKIVDINNIRDGALNPFTFLKDIDTSVILSIIELICGKLSTDEERAVTPIIQDFVTRFKRDGNYVDMQDVAEYLFSRDNSFASNLGARLKAVSDSKYGKLLFTREENVEPLELSLTDSFVISLHGMDLPDHTVSVENYTASQRFTSAIVYLLSSKLLEILSSNNKIPTVFCCDEAHLLFGNKAMSAIIDRFLVIGRSLGFATILASQGVSHFPKGIANHIATKFIFKSSMEEAGLFLSKFDTTQLGDNPIDREAIVGMVSSKFVAGDVFMIDKNNNSGFVHIVPNYPLHMLSSNPLDKLNNDKD